MRSFFSEWSVLALLMAGVMVAPVASAQLLTSDQVPPAIQQAFRTRFPTAKLAEWKLKPDKVYEAEFALKGIETAAKFDSAGKWLETESAIPPSKVPRAVRDTVARQFKGYKTVETQTLELWNERRPLYELHLQKATEIVKARFSADGAVLAQSSKPNHVETKEVPTK